MLVERQTPSIFPIISFVVTGGRDPAALRDYAYYDLRPRISRIDDVSYVTVQGGDVREILVEVEPQRLVGGRAVDRRRGRSAGQGAPSQGGGPHRPRHAAVPGARQHPGRQPARPGKPGHRRQQRPVDPPGDLGRVAVWPRRPHDGRSAPTARTPWP